MRTASKFRAILPNFHQIPAYVAPVREKSQFVFCSEDSLFLTVYRRASTSGTSRRDPPRHGDSDAQILIRKIAYVALFR